MKTRRLVLFLSAIIIASASFAGGVTDVLPKFTKVKASPHINVVLLKGETESLRLEYSGVQFDEINYGVDGNTFEIYLDDAKLTDKTVEVNDAQGKRKESYYKDAQITAYVTYVELRSIELRGEETLICNDRITAKDFEITLYGEGTVTLAHLEAEKLNGKFYGENQLTIKSGEITKQEFHLYGENEVNTDHVNSATISARNFGESRLRVFATDTISVFGIGESKLYYSGEAQVKKLGLGQLRITKI